jgi:predicted metal-dependent phosphoesterase TrpH
MRVDYNYAEKRFKIMKYRYETHCHTGLGSACGRFKPDEIVDFYREKGYSGIIITEHFLNGNSVARHKEGLTWQEQVDILASGYEGAKQYAKQFDFDVFFGWEYSYRSADILTYGFDKDWLLAHPDILSLSVLEYLDMVRSEGGLCIHAHPFRERSYIQIQHLFPGRIDGVEVINASHPDNTNSDEMARFYAELNHLKMSAGSDMHGAELGNPCFKPAGLEFERRLTSISDFIDLFKRGEYGMFRLKPLGEF